MKLYENLWYKIKYEFSRYFKIEELVNDNTYHELYSELYKTIKNKKFFDEVIFEEILFSHFQHFDYSLEYSESFIEDLIDYMLIEFEKAAQTHFLIVPLENSSLSNYMQFDKYHFIPKSDNELMFTTISKITSISRTKIKQKLNHTILTRNEEFMNSNLLVVEIKRSTQNLVENSALLAQMFITKMVLFYDAHTLIEERNMFQLGFLTRQNKHVAILSKNKISNTHSVDYKANHWCGIDLDFFDDSKIQNDFLNFINKTGPSSKQVFESINNAILLYSKTYNHNSDFSLNNLLLMTALESLIAKNKNEKRLRLSVVISNLISYPDKDKKEIYEIINKFYYVRNNFVHAGSYEYTHPNENVLKKIVSMVIYEIYLSCLNENIETDKKLLKHLDDYFIKSITLGINN